MTTMDKEWANNIKEGVNALILEVERLEQQIHDAAKIIDPNCSEGEDFLWLVKNYVQNVNEMMRKKS